MAGMSFTKRKNPFQKAKELEEEKKKKDDAEAARVYEEFVKDFAADDGSVKTFVRGGTIDPGKSSGSAQGAGAGPPGRRSTSRHYVPSFIPPGMAAAMRGDKAKSEESVFQLPGANKGKPRSIDLLLENMKKEQQQRELRKEQGLPPTEEETLGSFDAGDPTTTNLYIGNLAVDVDEQVLMREFGRFGPIGSVKIMWPRDEEQRRRGRNNGFVNFMRREDAERAKDALDGVTLHDLPLTIGWGKAMALPAVPVYPPPGGLAFPVENAAAVPPPRSSRPGRRERAPAPIVQLRDDVVGVGPTIEIAIPSDPRQRFVIDAVAFYVMRDGTEFEQVLMEQEVSNPEFNFLYDVRSPEHAYYRWRVYSLACGDSLRSWRVEPFVMVEASNKWVPPPMTLGTGGANRTMAQRGERKEDQPLSDLQRDKLEDMLRTLSVERSDICAAMVFALDNAESASEVSEVLCDSLCLAETPVPLKVARLFLLSDVLHNSTAPVRNASRYRSRLEGKLPDIFEALQEAYHSCDGRMAQDLLRRSVLRVLRAWRGKYLFSDDVLNGLQATFLRGAGAGANAPNPELEAEYEALGDEELELKCRRSGLTRRGGRAAQISRLLALDAYLRGDSGPSGSKQPGATAQPVAAKSGVAAVGMWAEVVAEEPPAPRSKWEEVAADEPPAPLAELSAPAPPPQSAAAPPDAAGVGAARTDIVDEGRRARLRQVEVEVMQLREDLEERGVGRQEVDRQAEELRARLLAEDGSRAGGSSSIRAGSSGGAREAPSAEKREWERERGREREGTRDRERESGRNRERKRSRSTEHRRASRSRSPRRHRSRSRDRKRR